MYFNAHTLILLQPQNGLPDVFIWMLSGGKRVAYTRVCAEDIIYSQVDSERGQYCGRVQTIFLRVSNLPANGYVYG